MHGHRLTIRVVLAIDISIFVLLTSSYSGKFHLFVSNLFLSFFRRWILTTGIPHVLFVLVGRLCFGSSYFQCFIVGSLKFNGVPYKFSIYCFVFGIYRVFVSSYCSFQFLIYICLSDVFYLLHFLIFLR